MTSNTVVVCTWGEGRGGVPGGAEAVLTLGRTASAAAGGNLRWLHLGPAGGALVEIAGKYGAAGLDRIEDDRLDTFQADAYVEAVAQYCAQRRPKMLLLPQTFDARVVAPRVAARVGAGVVMNALGLELDGAGHLRVIASAYGGDTRVVYELSGAPSYVVGVMADGITPEPASESKTPTPETFPVSLDAVQERVRVVERATSTGPRLEDAEIIVAGGRGLGEAKNFQLVEDLARALGGMAGASRPIVDDGWIDSSRQVGLTGKITRPVLYIAAGISGASQHMVGCSAAKTLVAINRDPDAAIFRYARYGIVGDCLEILPALTRVAKGGAA
jgi:electron transfer flavoprotein alpha subunit